MANSNSDRVVAAKRILVADPMHEQGRALLAARPGLTVDVVPGLDEGALIQKIDLTGLGIVSASGIAFAPGTDGGRSRLYLTASGVDNNVNPNENDGKLFELKFVKTP